jgi:hypothetical protein
MLLNGENREGASGISAKTDDGRAAPTSDTSDVVLWGSHAPAPTTAFLRLVIPFRADRRRRNCPKRIALGTSIVSTRQHYYHHLSLWITFICSLFSDKSRLLLSRKELVLTPSLLLAYVVTSTPSSCSNRSGLTNKIPFQRLAYHLRTFLRAATRRVSFHSISLG